MAATADARREARQALELDADNAVATEVLATLPPPSGTWTANLKADWDGFFAGYLTPGQDVLLPALTLVAAIFVLARLLVMLPVNWPRAPARGYPAWLWLTGPGTAGAAACLVVLRLPHATSGASTVLVLVGTGWLAAVSAATLAICLATRLRLSVEVREVDGVNDVAAGEIIALLGQLGGVPACGIEMPRGADVTALDGAGIIGSPTGRIAIAIAQLGRLVFGVTPWLVRVDVQENGQQAVVITRNGRMVASGVISRHALRLDTPPAGTTDPPSLSYFPAAMILVELSKRYDGFGGLFNVTDWRSVGLHAVATMVYTSPEDDSIATQLLARALEHDPRNLPAAFALRQLQDRNSTDRRQLAAYRDFLAGLLTQVEMPWPVKATPTQTQVRDQGYLLTMRARILLAYASAAANQYALDHLCTGGKRQLKTGDAATLDLPASRAAGRDEEDRPDLGPGRGPDRHRRLAVLQPRRHRRPGRR